MPSFWIFKQQQVPGLKEPADFCYTYLGDCNPEWDCCWQLLTFLQAVPVTAGLRACLYEVSQPSKLSWLAQFMPHFFFMFLLCFFEEVGWPTSWDFGQPTFSFKYNKNVMRKPGMSRTSLVKWATNWAGSPQINRPLVHTFCTPYKC